MTTENVRLSDVAEFDPPTPRNGNLGAASTADFLPMAAVDSDSLIARPTEQRPIETLLSGFTYFSDGDVLVAKITPCFENGKIAEVKLSSEHGFGSTEFHVVRARAGQLHPRYLTHFLRQPSVRHAGERRMTGSAGQRRVPRDFLRELAIPLPPLEEQRRIAAILDKADALRQKRRAALQKLDSLTQSLFLNMFGDPAANPKGLPLLPIGTIGTVVTGNTPSREISEYFGTAIEWVKSDNLNTPHYYVTRASEGLSNAGKAVARVAPANSILVTCIAGSPSCIGNAAMADRDVAFNQQINALIPRESDPHFLYAAIRAAKRKIQEASTHGMKGIVSKSRFERITLPIPPLELQRDFARRAASARAESAAQQASINRLESLFESLQHRAFRGEL